MSFVSFIIRCFSLFEESINCKDIHFSSYLAHSSCLSSLSPIYYTLKGIIYLPRTWFSSFLLFTKFDRYFYNDYIWFYSSFIVCISIILEDCYILFTFEFNSAIYFIKIFIFDCIYIFSDCSFCILIFFSFNYCILRLYYWSVAYISFSVYFIYISDICTFSINIFFIMLSYSSWILTLASLVLCNFFIAFFSSFNLTNLDDYSCMHCSSYYIFYCSAFCGYFK